MKHLIVWIFQIWIDSLSTIVRFLFKDRYALFSSHFGYKGEVKHVFLESKKNLKGYKVIWVCEHDIPALDVGDIVVKNSAKHWFLMLISDYIFVSHRLKDASYFKTKFCKLINCWHGEPIKYIGYDSNIERKWIEQQSKVYKITEYDHWDFILVNNNRYKDKMLSATKIPENKIILCKSQMYTDILLEKSVENQNKNKKKILFAPTFRPYDYSFDFFFTKDFLSFLESNNLYFDIKFHPMYPSENVSLSDRIRVLEPSIDINEIYLNYDLLISDYSSCIFDAEALGIDVIVFIPDLIQYSNIVGGLYEEFDKLEFLSDVCYSEQELLYFLSRGNYNNEASEVNELKLDFKIKTFIEVFKEI